MKLLVKLLINIYYITISLGNIFFNKILHIDKRRVETTPLNAITERYQSRHQT